MENLYIVSLESPEAGQPAERLEIQFVPLEVQHSRNSQLSSISIVGRDNPIQHWTTGNTSLSLTLDFYAEDVSRLEAVQKARWIQSLTYPNNQGITPRIKLIFGEMFLEEEWYVQNVQTKFSNFEPANNFLPVQVIQVITLAQDGGARTFSLEQIRALV